MTVLLDTLNVKLREWDAARPAQLVAACGGTLKYAHPAAGWFTVTIDHARASDLFLAYERHPDVERVDFAIRVKRTAVEAYHAASADPLLDGQWGLKRMNVFRAWAIAGKGNPAIKVGVVDDGLDLLSDYEARVVARRTIPGSSQLGSGIGHGNEVASTIAAGDNGIAGCGIAPDVSIVSVNIYDESEDGTDDGAISLGFNIAKDEGCFILNLSSGIDSIATPAAYAAGSIIDDTLSALAAAGRLVFIAAGNGATDDGASVAPGWSYPGALAPDRGHASVGCLWVGDEPALYSNYGTSPNLAAPGHRNWTAALLDYPPVPEIPAPGWVSADGHMEVLPDGTLRYHATQFNGTSCATPMAAAVAALVWSLAPPGTGGAFQASQVLAFMTGTVDKAQSTLFYEKFRRGGMGVLNAAKAVAKAKATRDATTIPYVNFFGPGVRVDVKDGVATTYLRGTVAVEALGITAGGDAPVQVYAGSTLLYSGVARTTWGTLLSIDFAPHAGKQLRVASNGVDVTYSDIVIEPVRDARVGAAPTTAATVAGGLVTLSASGGTAPLATRFRWDEGAWQVYVGPFAAQTGRLQFYSKDAGGHVEGGIDYAG